ncbi:YidC/Oxa1 family membrane protein insertase [Thermincola potens]|uniref:Membrane protein insertase, YidC/Oxa1 family n=1 Tax=Thermincola potens (strain JR) TaxID=635013 RepID=D5XDU6_THEPJ|nr:membrane protein insertase, YidC/Oxa1 family [Thermincola potens JR]
MAQLTAGMTALLEFFYKLTVSMGIPNYGLAIILITVLIKMLLLPLTIKQMKSLKMTQQLQPKVKEIQEKYKDPKQAQQAIMELYKQYGANPLSGCLPLLLQMPIIIALYRALMKFPYTNEAHAKFLWISNLSQHDKIVLPILAVLTTYLLQRMTTNMQDQTQKTMLIVMPLFIGWLSMSFPAGLALYWVVTNLVGAIQQYFINKMPLDIPVKEETGPNETGRKKRKNG